MNRDKSDYPCSASNIRAGVCPDRSSVAPADSLTGCCPRQLLADASRDRTCLAFGI